MSVRNQYNSNVDEFGELAKVVGTLISGIVHILDRPQFQPLVVRKLNAMDANRLVPNAPHQDHSVHGYRPKTELP
jgi:hypothetical protein